MGKLKWIVVAIGAIINIISSTWGWKLIGLVLIIVMMELGSMFGNNKPRRGKFTQMKYGR